MAIGPILETSLPSASAALLANLAGADSAAAAEQRGEAGTAARRRLSVYPSFAGFEMVEELAFLANRSVEKNIFFNPLFLAPAMPRLEERPVRLAVVRDGGPQRDRLRFLMPFSIERPGFLFGPEAIRAWSHPFGPLGTPLLDPDDPPGLMHDLLEMLATGPTGMPKVLILPDIRLDGPFAGLLRDVVAARKLSIHTVNPYRRAVLASPLSGPEYLRQSLSSHHDREYRRLRRRLDDIGDVDHVVSEGADSVRLAFERFLLLEASGWKGRRGTALATDRLQSAFAREAVNGLAARGLCRIHELTLNGTPIASTVVFLEENEAYTWKTAYDENYARFSPGTLLMIEITHRHLADRTLTLTDSCAVENHPVMDRLWQERRAMGTLVIGLGTDERRAASVARWLRRRHRIRAAARGLYWRMEQFREKWKPRSVRTSRGTRTLDQDPTGGRERR